MSLKNKLNRLKPHISTQTQDKEKKTMTITPQEEPSAEKIPFHSVWESHGIVPFYFDDSYCLVRKVEYPLDYQHGCYKLSDAARAIKEWNFSEVKHPLSAIDHSPGDLFFFDTETTGLGGGAGNTIFLLGHARLTRNSVILTQHLLPHPGGEVALYQSFLSEVNYRTLVTYNGKAFDWPQVKTRHTLVRDHVPKLPEFGHFDLFHAAKRLWKHRVERMKLSIVEKEILGFERKDDIPGYLAPMIYFDFLERKEPEGVLGVMKHNEHDILSLMTLYAHLSFQLLGIDGERTSKETYEVGRWYSYIGEKEMAAGVFREIADGEGDESLSARLELALELKRQGNFKEAERLWVITSEAGRAEWAIPASIELAKYHEHKTKDLNRARLYACKAAKLLDGQNGTRAEKLKFDVSRRLARLEGKLMKAGLRGQSGKN